MIAAERASEVSSVEQASKAGSVEQMDEWAVRANKRADKLMAYTLIVYASIP